MDRPQTRPNIRYWTTLWDAALKPIIDSGSVHGAMYRLYIRVSGRSLPARTHPPRIIIEIVLTTRNSCPGTSFLPRIFLILLGFLGVIIMIDPSNDNWRDYDVGFGFLSTDEMMIAFGKYYTD